jgi:hypothetical protein
MAATRSHGENRGSSPLGSLFNDLVGPRSQAEHVCLLFVYYRLTNNLCMRRCLTSHNNKSTRLRI